MFKGQNGPQKNLRETLVTGDTRVSLVKVLPNSLSEYGSEGFRVRLRRLSEYGSVAYLVERPTRETQVEQYSDNALLLRFKCCSFSLDQDSECHLRFFWSSQRTEKGAGGKGPCRKTSKSVKNIFDIFRAGQKKNVENRQKSVKIFFDTFRAAPVFRPLLGGL